MWVDGSPPLRVRVLLRRSRSYTTSDARGRSGLSRAQDRAFLIGVRRDVSAAGGEIRLRGRGRGRLRELKYKRREMDLRRTTLASEASRHIRGRSSSRMMS